MLLVIRLWLVLGLAVTSCTVAEAQPMPLSPVSSAASTTQAASAEDKREVAVEQASVRRIDAETRYAEAYYAHLAKMNEITEGKFVWQDRASNVTLWLVAFVVVSGVGLSFFQIWIAFHQPPGASAGTGDTTIEASATSFRVTSSVVGIVILVIATGFLYLFLKEVYDIKIIDITKATPAPAESNSPSRGAIQAPISMEQFGLPPPDARSIVKPTPTPVPSRKDGR